MDILTEESIAFLKQLEKHGVNIRVLHLKHLLENKIKAGRTKDYDDVKNLKDLHKDREQGPK